MTDRQFMDDSQAREEATSPDKEYFVTTETEFQRMLDNLHLMTPGDPIRPDIRYISEGREAAERKLRSGWDRFGRHKLKIEGD